MRKQPVPMPEQDYESQNQEETQNESLTNEREQESPPPSPVPSSSDTVSRADFESVSKMAQRLIETDSRRQAEFEKLQAQLAKPVDQTHDFATLNKKMVEDGNLAEGINDLMRRNMQPLLDQNAAAQRQSKLNNLVLSYAQNHRRSNHLVPIATQLAAEVAKNIGDVDPQAGMVKLVIDGLIGQALDANPTIFDTPVNNQQNPDSTIQTQQPVTNSRPPLPPQIPNNRPAPQGNPSAKGMTESEKRVKEAIDPHNKMSDADFLANLAEDQGRDIEYDMEYVMKLANEKGKANAR